MRQLLIIAAVIVITACQSPPATQLPTTYSNYQNTLIELTDWKIEGRLLYRDANDKHSANLFWHQQGQNFSLSLNTFLGTQILSLTQTEQGATLILDGETYQDSDAKRLLWRLTGWHLPVDELTLWIKGLHAGDAIPTFAEEGWLAELRYQQWQVEYDNYRKTDSLVLPHLIELTDPQRRIKIKVNQWTTL